jgi:aerotaxis receptor
MTGTTMEHGRTQTLRDQGLRSTQREVQLQEDDTIVSKTDLTGCITYVNRTFMRISDYPGRAVLGEQHNVIRHPDMPRGLFRLMWDTLGEQREFFGLLKNMTANGDYYWAFIIVAPDLDGDGEVVGYDSVRRKAPTAAIRTAEQLYREMLRVEYAAGAAVAPEASVAYLQRTLTERHTTYDRFLLGLYQQ